MTADSPPPRRNRGRVLIVGFVVLAVGVVAAKFLSQATQVASDEQAAIATLAQIASSQVTFRHDDADGDSRYDYGTLVELCRSGLLDADLAQGSRAGYVFTCEPHPHTPEFVWWATATPKDSSGRSFAVNQRGSIVANGTPFPRDPQPMLPPDAAVVGSFTVAAPDSDSDPGD